MACGAAVPNMVVVFSITFCALTSVPAGALRTLLESEGSQSAVGESVERNKDTNRFLKTAAAMTSAEQTWERLQKHNDAKELLIKSQGQQLGQKIKKAKNQKSDLTAFGEAGLSLLFVLAIVQALGLGVVDVFGMLDVRSLALGRVLCGLTLVWNLFDRLQDLDVLYSNTGLLPCEALGDASFACMLDPAIHKFIFLLGLPLAAALTIGLFTRVATFAAWFLVLLLHNRNPYGLHCGDSYMLMLLFWANFLPWGRCWSFDRLLSKSEFEHIGNEGSLHVNVITSPGAFGFVLQLVIVLLATGFSKVGPEWQAPDFTAVSLALHINMWVREPGIILRAFPQLCRVMTRFTIVLEQFGPWLLIFPLGNVVDYVRLLGCLVFIGFYIGIGSCLILDLIPPIFIAGTCCLLPPVVWDRAFLGVRHEAALNKKKLAVHSDGASAGTELRCFRSMMAYGIPVLLQAVAAVFVIFIAADASGYNIPECFAPVVYTGVWTSKTGAWGMFTSGIAYYDGWLELSGSLANGTVVDLGNASDPMVQDIFAWGRGFNASAYMYGYAENYDESLIPYFAGYLCRRWNRYLPEIGLGNGPNHSRLLSVSARNMVDETEVDVDRLHFVKQGPLPVFTFHRRCSFGS